jgi:hypothetical protein
VAEHDNCDALERPPEQVRTGIERDPNGDPVAIYVSPRGDLRYVPPEVGPAAGQTTRTLPLDEALSLAAAGTTLYLLPGRYYRPARLTGRKGSPDQPIIIRGVIAADGSRLTQIAGTNAATPIYPALPERERDWAFLKLWRCRHIEIRDVAVESCWPSFVYAEDCQNITLRNVRAVDGLYVLFARGHESRGFTVEGNEWVQDPTGSLWREIAFEELHHGLYGYYNGALFGSLDCRGDVAFHRNTVRYAFNGIRMAVSPPHPPGAGRFNVDVEVAANHFECVRDNAVEPEGTALNWHIRHNRFLNCHAPLSLHGLTGGWWYVYGNEGWFDDRPGRDFQENRGGKILKLHGDGPFPEKPWFFFNNSFYTRTFLTKKGRTERLRHVNNAYLFCDPADYEREPCLCRPGRRLLKDFPTPPGWPDEVVFDHDLSSQPFGEVLDANGQERHGLGGADPLFVDPRRGDFRLKSQSPARGAGTVVTLQPGTDWAGQQVWRLRSGPSGAIDIGARQGAQLVEGPPFVRVGARDV